MHMAPPNSTGYNSLPDEEPDTDTLAEAHGAEGTAVAASSGDLGSGSTMRYG
jgi:hypothetical protein